MVNSELRSYVFFWGGVLFLGGGKGTLRKSGTVCITLNICIAANVIFYVRTTFYADSVDMFDVHPHKIHTPSIYKN